MKKIILSSIVAIALLTGCGEEKKVAETKAVEEVKQEIVKTEPKVVEEVVKVEEKTPETKLVDQVKESASNVAQKVVQETKKVAEVVPQAVKSVSEKVTTKTEEVTKGVVAAASETKEKIEATVTTVVASAKEATVSADADLVQKGKGLFTKCISCHGANAEKAALGKSQIIKGWESSKTIESLNGYKDGSYGGAMKAIMKGQVATLSDEDIKAIAAYVNTL